MRLTLPKIYPITDRQLSGLSHAEQVQRLINGGATFVQLREKHLPPMDFLREAEAAAKVASVGREMAQTELTQLLGGPDDRRNAIVVLHPGAGGTEAQDWAEILLRMYLRWAERKGYKTEILEIAAASFSTA